MTLNLIPIPPLDGGRIASSLLPDSLSSKFNRLEPFGILILIVLLITGGLAMILLPAINAMLIVTSFVFGIDSSLLNMLGS
jgi:Zn-dependent protease